MRLILTIILICSVSYLFGQKKVGKNKKAKKEPFHYLSHCKTNAEIEKLNSKLEIVYYLHMGEFSNQEQMDTSSNPELKPQEIIRVPIWQKERVGEYWGISNLIAPNVPDKAVGQVVFKFSKLNRDTFLVESFGVPNAMKGTFWAYEKGYAEFKPSDLIKLDCAHFLVGDKMEYRLFLPEGQKPCNGRDISTTVHAFELGGLIEPWGAISTTTYYAADGKILRSNKNNPVYLKRGDVKNPKYKTLFNNKM
jgi:hypothetical protein